VEFVLHVLGGEGLGEGSICGAGEGIFGRLRGQAGVDVEFWGLGRLPVSFVDSMVLERGWPGDVGGWLKWVCFT